MRALLGDIGGTNARFCLADLDRQEVSDVRIYPSCVDPSFEDAVRRYLTDVDAGDIDAMVVAAGGPQFLGTIDLTNVKQGGHDWRIAEADFPSLCGASARNCLLMNDFEGLAYAVPSLRATDWRKLGDGPDTPLETATIALIGPGTGLGVAGLLPARGDTPERAIAGEGGHITFAAETEREWQIISHMRDQFGHVSAERLASGLGLVDSYRTICALDGVTAELPDGQAIALSDKPQAQEAVALFATALGAAAGSIALSLGATGGVYVAGGILPKWGDRFRDDLFRARFDAKGRFEPYMKLIPTRLVTAELPAFTGLMRVAAQFSR
ncbi:MAG: glucokinase [Alphaproteobacteria bacterium]